MIRGRARTAFAGASIACVAATLLLAGSAPTAGASTGTRSDAVATPTPLPPRSATATPGLPRAATATPGLARATATPGLARATATPGLPRAATVTPGLPPDAVRLRDVASTVLQEMRYAGSHNFVGRPVVGYEAPECWLTRRSARALGRVQRRVVRQGYTLKVYDCFRPQRAVDDFVAWAADPAATRMRAEFYPTVPKDELFERGYIAARSSHSRGSTVDVTLVPLGEGVSPHWHPDDGLTRCTAPARRRFPDTSIDMGTGFDCFDRLAHLASTAIREWQRRNRAVLLTAMVAEGFNPYAEEWWHFTLDDEPHPDTYYDAPVTRRGRA